MQQRYRVTQTRTITIVHVIKADSPSHAKRLMDGPTNEGLVDILEDDSETEYEVELDSDVTRRDFIMNMHDVPTCEIKPCALCTEYYKILTRSIETKRDADRE